MESITWDKEDFHMLNFGGDISQHFFSFMCAKRLICAAFIYFELFHANPLEERS